MHLIYQETGRLLEPYFSLRAIVQIKTGNMGNILGKQSNTNDSDSIYEGKYILYTVVQGIGSSSFLAAVVRIPDAEVLEGRLSKVMESMEVEKQLPVLVRELAGQEKYVYGIIMAWQLCEMDLSKSLDPMVSEMRLMGSSTLYKLDESRFVCFFDDEEWGRLAWQNVKGQYIGC